MKKPENQLEWIIGDAYGVKKGLFKDIFPNKENIESIMMLWDSNSYYLNVASRYFIINGGRRIQPTALLEFDSLLPLAVKRHRTEMSATGDETGDDSVSFLLGVEGILRGEKRQLMLHISPDGSLWAWKDKR